MNYIMTVLARLFAPYIWTELEPLIDEKLLPIAYRATDAQLATDTLAEKLGYVITIDGSVATVHGVK